jgi:serine/threonine protein kinase
MIAIELPFSSNDDKDTMRRTIHEKPKFDAPEWKHFSEEVIPLIKSLLSKDPKNRPTTE